MRVYRAGLSLVPPPLPGIQLILGQRLRKGIADFKLALHGAVAPAARNRLVEIRSGWAKRQPYAFILHLDHDFFPRKRALERDEEDPVGLFRL